MDALGALWVPRNIENKTLPQYFTDLNLNSLQVSNISDLSAGVGLTIDANKGGPLVLQNLTLSGISIVSSGTVAIESTLSNLTLESNGILSLQSILGPINVTSPILNLNTPSVNLTGAMTIFPTVAPVLSASSCSLWYPIALGNRPKMSVFTTLQTDYNISLETPTTTSVNVPYSSLPVGIWSVTAPVRYYKIGRLGVLWFSTALSNSIGNFNSIQFNLPVGVPFPFSIINQTISVTLPLGTITTGRITIDSAGAGFIVINTPVTVPPYPATPQFTAGFCGFLPFSVVYESIY